MRRQTVSLIGALVLLAAVRDGKHGHCGVIENSGYYCGGSLSADRRDLLRRLGLPADELPLQGLLSGKFAGRGLPAGATTHRRRCRHSCAGHTATGSPSSCSTGTGRTSILSQRRARRFYLKLHDHEVVGFRPAVRQPRSLWRLSGGVACARQSGGRRGTSCSPTTCESAAGRCSSSSATTLFQAAARRGTAGVDAALATLQNAAHQHGLPGVFVVGVATPTTSTRIASRGASGPTEDLRGLAQRATTG